MDFDVIQRVIADAIMINLAVLLTLTARFFVYLFLWRGEVNRAGNWANILDHFFRANEGATWLLTGICLIAFWMSGFYTYGRAYQSRYKMLVVAQAVSIGFLVFGFLNFFLPITNPYPRSVLIGSWIVTLLFVETARVWTDIWKRSIRTNGNRQVERDEVTRKVLVIGGAGYIGSTLVRQLLLKGYNVTVLDSLIYGDESIRDLYGVPHFEFFKGDLRDIEAVVGAMQSIDCVIHLGALVGDPACAINEQLTLEINTAATRMIAEVAKGFGVRRFIFASTCSVYGASDLVLDEKSDLNPVSLYAKSKIASEQVLLRMADDRFTPTIVRFATIFGLSPRPRFDLVVNFLTARAMAEKVITIMGGRQWRPFIHVADAAEAIIRTVEAPMDLVRGEILNVGSDTENYQLSQIGALIKQYIPEVQIVTNGEDPDQRNYRVSFKKFRERVGFVPSRSVRHGIAEIKDAIRNGVIKNYLSAKYSNHKTLADEGMAVRIQRDNILSSLFNVDVDAAVAQSQQPKARHKLLIVDDDEMHLNLMKTILEDEGYEVLMTTDGPQGIAIYQEKHPDVVLLDLGLPSMNGLDVLKQLRAMDAKAKVIIVTGHGSLESAEGFRHGARDYLRKPFEIPEFLTKIKSVLANGNGAYSGNR